MRAVAVVSLVLTAALPGHAAIPAAERSALVTFFSAASGSQWANRAGWLGKPGTECSWFGVRCNAAGAAVTGLLLSDNGLSGAVPASVANLPQLQTIELGLNRLSGTLPRELGSLAKLESLSLPFNRLSGSLPPELGRLARLQVLDLAGNELSGSVPPQLGDLRELRFLDLSANRLSGSIPSELGRLVRLTALQLGANQLSGAIPGQLGGLAALELLSLSDNQLSGRIPAELGNLSSLLFLDLSRNQLAGSVPSELGRARSLIGLLLSANRLGGNIPGAFYDLTSLETLWLDHNRFTGPVPFELGALSTLQDNGGLDLRANALATDTEAGLLADLNAKQLGGSWIPSQAASAPLEPELPLGGLADRRAGGFVVWTLAVGAGAPPLTVNAGSGGGDADLYVRFGASPTLAEHDAASSGSGNQESVTIASPRQGTYYIGLHAKSPYAGVELAVSGLTGCLADATTLCLGDGRFKVQVAWRTPAGAGVGRGAALTADTGYFWFFHESNVEMVIKVLDACALNGRFWIFAGGLTDVQVDITVTDTAAEQTRTYRNPAGTAFQPIQDTGAFATCGAAGASTAVAELAESTAADLQRLLAPSASCAAGPASLCLNGARFRVDVAWRTPNGHSGAGQAVPLTADTGYFWFFDAANVEMVIKVLDACGLNNRYWVFAGGLTDVDTTILVTDTMTAAQKTYRNPQGTAFRPIQDSSAFATCP